jgi:hypothetical protein
MIIFNETSTKLLYSLLDELKALKLFPVIGLEIEFYLTCIYDNLQDHFKTLGIEIDKEKGDNQFEFRVHHNKDIFAVINEAERIKSLLSLLQNSNYAK